MHTLILSDLHLGTKMCQAESLLRLLETSFDRLILNGDTLDSFNLKKLKLPHWQVLDRLQWIASRRHVVLIRGNHDMHPRYGHRNLLAKLVGGVLVEDYEFSVGEKNYLVLHGDKFDPTLNWPVLTDIADWCYQQTQTFDRRAAKWLKKKVKKLGGIVECVKLQAVKYANLRDCDGVITGHTHFPNDEMIDGVHYLNCGSWTETPCTYVSVEKETVQLKNAI